MRLVLIGGFGEDEHIFDKIKTALPGNQLVLSLWNLVPSVRQRELNVTELARQLITQFTISKSDVIIGHSAGGWLAIHIKNIIGCTVIQIASWTNREKVIAPISNTNLIYWAAGTPLFFNRWVLHWRIKRSFANNPSKDIFASVFTNLIKGPKPNVVNQLRLIFNPYPEVLNVKPDLAIHAKADQIIQHPDEPFVEVPGDHFSLYTYPEHVCAPILSLLVNRQKIE